MSAGFVLLAALFLAVPITVKYVTSFQIRALMDGLKRREREIDLMYAQLDGLDQEREVIERAVMQVYEQRRWSTTRRSAGPPNRGRWPTWWCSWLATTRRT